MNDQPKEAKPTSSGHVPIITNEQVDRAWSRVVLTVDGIADGGVCYTPDEMQLMFQAELAKELGITLRELHAQYYK